MEQKQLKSREEVLADFARKGISIRGWAKKHCLSHSVVNGVLNGRLSGRIGESHRAAVMLGIKDGEITENGHE